jgi:LPS-assembly lipoprotein
MPKHVLLIHALFILTLFVAACGFEPVYGINRNMPVGVETHLSQVDIGRISGHDPEYDREGQYLRNALIDRFYRSGRPVDPRYKLEITELNEDLVELDITKSADATRGQLRISTVMILKDARTDERLLGRRIAAITSYNILASEFATRVTEDNARTNALDDLARQIEQHLSLYFRKEYATGTE